MGLLLCAIRHQSWDSKARNYLSLSEMQWWIRVFQITNKSKNSSCEVVMVASQNILCFHVDLPTEKRPWEDQTELESSVLSLEKHHKVVRLNDNSYTKHYVNIDFVFVFQPSFCLLLLRWWLTVGDQGARPGSCSCCSCVESGIGGGTSHPHPLCHQTNR